jgi:hypothetical protein
MTSSVNSRISPKQYESLLSEIEEEDRNIKSDLYELSIYDHTIHISPGKTIEDDEIKDLVYCYVYVVKNDKVVQKLGVYEKFTKEKEDFFDLSTFEKGTLCLFEKYETNPSLFLDFKTDLVKEPKEKKPKKKSKAQAEQAQVEETMPEAVEVDLNAETPKIESPKVEPVEVDLNAVSNPEVDLNAPETFKQEPVEVDLNAESPKATAEAKVETPKAETKPKPPTLLDVNELEKDLSLEKPKKSKSKIKLKAEKAEPKVETPKVAKDESPKAEAKAETKAKVETPKRKTGTKKSKPILVDGEIPGTKFG